jgi:hypothetical protein
VKLQVDENSKQSHEEEHRQAGNLVRWPSAGIHGSATLLGVAARDRADPARDKTDLAREAVRAIEDWLRDDTCPVPSRADLAAAVRLTARILATQAPGASVEVRIPPFVAVQCVSGPRHTRGTPPNVVETDPRTWLLLATGLLAMVDANASGALQLSGSRAGEIQDWLPLVPLAG